MSSKSLFKSFIYAVDGIVYLIKTERNFRIQLTIGVIAIIAGVFFKLTEVEWLFVVSAIFRVLGHESINTSVEVLADECEQRKDLDIKHIKDMSAAYVLLSAIYSIVVGIVIFVPKILRYIR
jgi:diacylglycerol kinase